MTSHNKSDLSMLERRRIAGRYGLDADSARIQEYAGLEEAMRENCSRKDRPVGMGEIALGVALGIWIA